MQTINDYILKIIGGASLPGPLETDKTCLISTQIDITEVAKRTNNDGTHDVIYKSKISSHIDIEQGGVIIRAKDPRKNSQKIRGAVWNLQQDEGMTHIEEEMFYNQMSAIIIEHLPELFHKFYNK